MTAHRFFVNRGVDFLFIGGASLITYLILAFWKWDGQLAQVTAAAGYLSWVVNWPHFAATLQRVSARPENTKVFPLTVKFLPLLILAGVAAALASPDGIAPYFVKFYLMWSPYHFSGQTVGVTLLYARRNQLPVSPWGRKLLSLFVFGTFASSLLEFEISTAGSVFYGVPYPGLGVAPQFSRVAYWLTYAAGAAWLIDFFRGAYRIRRVPLMVLLPVVAQLVWFIVGRGNAAFYLLVPFFHSLQYLLVVWGMALVDKKRNDPQSVSQWKTETAYWYAGNVAGGVALFHILPMGFVYAGVAPLTATAVLLAGIQLHHFFVDGVVWKLRSTRVNEALTQNVPLTMRTA